MLGDAAANDVDSVPLRNANPDTGNESITVEGGIRDGNTSSNPRGAETDRNGYTGVMISFRNVRGLTLTDMRQKNSGSYHTRLSAVRDFRVERITFEDTVRAPNQDGIHVAGCCEDGLIRDIVAVGEFCTGDDLVALNADYALDRSETRGGLGLHRRIRVSSVEAFKSGDEDTALLRLDERMEDSEVERSRRRAATPCLSPTGW